jgi:hypothetical protein
MFYYNKRSKLSVHKKHLFSFMAAKLLLIIRTIKQRRLEGSHATLEFSNHCEHLPFLQFVVANFIKYHKESPQRHEFCDIFCNDGRVAGQVERGDSDSDSLWADTENDSTPSSIR